MVGGKPVTVECFDHQQFHTTMRGKVDVLKIIPTGMTKKWKYVLKVFVQVVLLVLALNFFGLPSLRRYFAKEVVVIRSTDEQSGLPTPAVTVCPLNPQTSSGFPRNGFNSSFVDSRIGEASKGEEEKDIARCVDKATYNLSSTVGYLHLPGNTWVGPDELQKLWVADFTDKETGICFTLNRTYYHFPPVTNPEEYFSIGFINNTDYVVLLHDPNLFLVTYNDMMPITKFRFEKPNFFARGVVITQHHNLDLPSKPCSSLPSYSFTACVLTFLSHYIGCRLPWDTWTDLVRFQTVIRKDYRLRREPCQNVCK